MNVDKNVVTIVAVIISLAFVDPFNTRRLITVVGIIVTDDVLIIRKVIMLREATLLSLFNLFNSFMAFNPNGVAAFPKPNIFIMILEDI